MKTLPLAPADDTCCAPRPKLRAKETAGYTSLLRALSDETRLKMTAMLAAADEPICACDLEGSFDLTQPTISHHLKVLKDAGVVTTEKRGTWVFYEIDRKRLDALGRLHEVLRG